MKLFCKDGKTIDVVVCLSNEQMLEKYGCQCCTIVKSTNACATFTCTRSIGHNRIKSRHIVAKI